MSAIQFSRSRRRNFLSRRNLKTSIRDFYLDDFVNFQPISNKVAIMSGDNQARQRRKVKRKQKQGMTILKLTAISGIRKITENLKINIFVKC